MMVVGLRREASTSRSRSWLIVERLPAPARLGARSPWNLVSGNGPLWQRMQVLVRSSTSARPRAASPGAPVSDSAMESPVMIYGRNSCAVTEQGIASAAAATSQVAAMWIIDLAKGFHRDRFVPGLRLLGFTHPHLARRVERAGEAAAFNLGKNVVPRLIDAREREGIAGRDGVVTGAVQFRHRRCRAGDQACDDTRACLGLGVGG